MISSRDHRETGIYSSMTYFRDLIVQAIWKSSIATVDIAVAWPRLTALSVLQIQTIITVNVN